MALAAVYIILVCASVFQVLGLLLTAWRIYIRLKIHRFWWEDAWATILLLTGLLWMIAQYIFLLANNPTSIVNSWIYAVGFTCIVTLVRMSVMFSIIRIIRGNLRLLKLTYACVMFYTVCWVILLVEKIVDCTSDTSWRYVTIKTGRPFCMVKTPVSIYEFTTDCVAVSILVVLPLRILWNIKLPTRQRRMILSIFASSISLALGALFHTVFHNFNMFTVTIAGINVEVALSFFVCNLLVLVTYTYRFLLRDRDGTTVEDLTNNDDDFTVRLTTRPVQPAALSLTTVDLDSPNIDCVTTRIRGNTISYSHGRAE